MTRAAWLAPSAPTSAGPTPVTRWAPSRRLPRRQRPAPAAATGAQLRPGRDGTRSAGSETGLYFICLAADLARQFEFVQHTWLNNATFNGLYDDADPLTGTHHPAGATFTVPARPVRHRYRGLPQFVRTRGGAYFFLPGVSAVRYLAQLGRSEETMHTISTTSPGTLVPARRGELARLFGAGRVGDIPDGHGRGTVLLGTGGLTSRLAAGLSYALAWRGKIVDARRARLKNILTPLEIRAIEAVVYKQDSWYDGHPCIVLDYSKTSLAARQIRDEIREIAPGVFLGLVFWGRHHVLDFALDFTQ